MEIWKDVAQWLWGLFVLLFGLMLKTKTEEINELRHSISELSAGKVNRSDYEYLQNKLSIEVKDLYTKIDVNQMTLQNKMDNYQKETRDRLDRILEKMN